jgi:hypothetical protein
MRDSGLQRSTQLRCNTNCDTSSCGNQHCDSDASPVGDANTNRNGDNTSEPVVR